MLALLSAGEGQAPGGEVVDVLVNSSLGLARVFWISRIFTVVIT
ncbi:MAG: hypothetical protein ABI877_09450 [Gemmatimonadaceae bacterium]